MSSARYFQVTDGEPWYEEQGVNYEQCCDCGLVHKVKYVVHDNTGKRIKGAKIQLTAWRAQNQTRLVRRKRKKAIVVMP